VLVGGRLLARRPGSMALYYVQTTPKQKLAVSNFGTRWVFDDNIDCSWLGLVVSRSLAAPALSVLLWFGFFFWECGVLVRFASAQPTTPTDTPAMAATSWEIKRSRLTSPSVSVLAVLASVCAFGFCQSAWSTDPRWFFGYAAMFSCGVAWVAAAPPPGLPWALWPYVGGGGC
jgi:hypothetical protein